MDTSKGSIGEKWSDINWRKVEVAVFRLQKRIFRASQSGNVRRVRKLQRLLTNSYYGKLWAIRKVTQDNQGKKTAGVDGVKSLTPKERLLMVKTLRVGTKPKPLRRVWIPKPDGSQRGLGIPSIYDRALQCLVKLALEPQWEALFEENSYGFRPGRSCHDAIAAIFNSINKMPKYVLDADIAKCFDKINHEKLLTKLNTYPLLKKQIKLWLKSGVMDKGNWFPTNEGTPQGGVISPLLANIALHGMETQIKDYACTLKGGKAKNKHALSFIRYADDFVILHKDLEVVTKCKEIISNWLLDLGLELKESKTRITHTLNEYEGKMGFDFLGFTVRQYPAGKTHSKRGFKTIIKPSKDKVKNHIKKVGEIIDKHKSSPQEALIRELNPVIRGWSNYYSTQVSKEIYSYCDYIIYNQLKRWGERRHPNKNKSWVANKYWHTHGGNNWTFSTRNEIEGGMKLYRHAETPIVRHVKVKGNCSPYDGNLTYWSSRMGKHPEMDTRRAKLLKQQKGKCKHCGLTFRDGDLMEVDHMIPKSKGGKDEYKNLQLLHKHCHDEKTAKDGSLNCTHDKGLTREEPYEVKISRTVLKTSQRGDSLA